MSTRITTNEVKSILTRSSGYLETVSSHSLQPYRGCTFGRSLCGAGCYVQHNRLLTQNQPWGDFLEVRTNSAERYSAQYGRESGWARNKRDRFAIFMSSSTDPFVPQEDRFRVTRTVLEAMIERPPDLLILQTHTHRVTMYSDLYLEMNRHCDLRIHLTVESDRDRLPGLPPPASSVERRLSAATELKKSGLNVVVTVSPLLPIVDPRSFFRRIADTADAVVIDHFIQGDGTSDGMRTRRTALPRAMTAVHPGSDQLAYRDEIVKVAQEAMPGRVGVSIDGFAGRYLPNHPEGA